MCFNVPYLLIILNFCYLKAANSLKINMFFITILCVIGPTGVGPLKKFFVVFIKQYKDFQKRLNAVIDDNNSSIGLKCLVKVLQKLLNYYLD